MKLALIKLFIVTNFMLLASVASSFQVAISDKIKASYVFNFTKYLEWPDNNNLSSINIGFYGQDDNYFQALQQMQGLEVKDLNVNITRIDSVNTARGLQILVLDKASSQNISTIAMQLSDQATVIVSDNANDEKHTMLNLVLTKENKLVFELNRYNVLVANVKVLPDILVLGGTEVDIVNVLKEMDETITKSLTEIKAQSQRLEQLSSEVDSREKQILIQQNKLELQKELLVSQANQLEQQNAELIQSKQDFDLLQGNYSQIEQALNTSQVQLSKNNEGLVNLKNEIKKKEQDIIDLSDQIEERKKSLAVIERQFTQQEKELAKHSNVIETQSTILMTVMVISSAILVILFVVYRSKQVQHQINQELEINISALAEANDKLSSAQDKLVESEKMAALGGLVAGVAHEINTPVGVSITAASHLSGLLETFEEDFISEKIKKSTVENFIEKTKDSNDILLRNLDRAGELISSFKQVAVDQSSESLRDFELKTYINELIQSLSPKLKQGNHVIHVTSNEVIDLCSYPGVLAQILTNLIMNTLHHGFKEKQHGEIYIELALEDNEVSIDYSDNGIGLTEQQREKVFEPFYTTARATGGSGLGMSICYNLVTSKLKGIISCLPATNGAHFKIVFPRD